MFLWNAAQKGGGGAPEFYPPSITGGWQLLLNAESIPGMTEGATVAPWPDLSGNARDGTASGTPIYRADIQGGKAGVEFITAGRKFVTPSFLDSSYDTAFSIYAIVKKSGALTLWSSNDSTVWYGGSDATDESLNTSNLSDTIVQIPNNSTGARLVTFRYGGATKKAESFRHDSIWRGKNESATGNLGLSGALTIGDFSAGGFALNGQIGTLGVVKGNVSDAEHIALCNYLLDYYSMPRPFNVFFDGNSLTLGTGASGAPAAYPAVCLGLLGSGYVGSNIAGGGAVTADLNTAAPTTIDIYFDALRPKIAVLWECTNDLVANENAAGAISRYATWCSGRQAAGFQVVAVTVLPRTPVGIYAGFEADRQTVNASIRANWATYADALADVADDARIGAPGASNDTTYYNLDKIHENDAGYAIDAQIVADAIETL